MDRSNWIEYWDNSYDSTHLLSIDVPDALVILLAMEWTKLLFESKIPTEEELESCSHI